MYLYYNDSLMDEAAAVISPMCQGFQFGIGVFETMLAAHSKVSFMELHLERLNQGCNKLGLQLSLDKLKLESQAKILIQKNNIVYGRLKLVCFRDVKSPSLLMTVIPYDYKDEFSEEGYKVQISEIKRNPNSPVSYIKALNYAENILAREEALRQGYDEALLLNVYNKVSEGTVSNIFWIKNDKVYTPEIGSGILGGIMRSQVIKLCNSLQLEVLEGSFELSELLQADEVFVTNSLIGIMPVSRIENNDYEISSYKLARKLHAELKELTRADFNL